jgi:hypothetical protein
MVITASRCGWDTLIGYTRWIALGTKGKIGA